MFVATKKVIGESDTILKVTLRIYASYIAGLSSLRFLFEVLEIQNKDLEKFLTIPDFFNYLYGVSYSSTVMNLSNILIDNDDSINLYYLNSLFRKTYLPNKLNSTGCKNLSDSISAVLDTYSKTSDFYIGLKELRDKFIAHIDKSKFHTAKGPSKKITVEEIKSAFDTIGSLVGDLIGTLGINPDLIEFENPDIANFQFRLLINDMNSNPLIDWTTSAKLEASGHNS